MPKARVRYKPVIVLDFSAKCPRSAKNGESLIMNRRKFCSLTGTSLAGVAAGPAFADHHGGNTKPFKAMFAPHSGLLPTGPKDYLDQMKFA